MVIYLFILLYYKMTRYEVEILVGEFLKSASKSRITFLITMVSLSKRQFERGDRKSKKLKINGCENAFLSLRGLLVILRKGCTNFRISKSLILYHERRLPWYVK